MVGNGGAEGTAESFESLLGGLRDEFVASIRFRAESMNVLALELRQTEAPSAILTRLAREAHTLKGSAGTFDLAHGDRRVLDQQLVAGLDLERPSGVGRLDVGRMGHRS